MEPDIKKLNQLLLSGSCCSQALVSLGLTLKGEENPSLLKASASLCLGVRSGLTCGALTGAAMMMALFEPGSGIQRDDTGIGRLVSGKLW